MPMFDVVQLGLFSARLSAICEEMGASLRRSAFSPNIKDRLDYSCAVFDGCGDLAAQAAHIPVHLGSMAYAMRGLISQIQWQSGDAVIVNDPYQGGTHLPDVTVIMPVFIGEQIMGFIANRAHHANIGAQTPGSMPIASHLEEEGAIIPPSLLIRDDKWDESILLKLSGGAKDPRIRADFLSQVSACKLGVARFESLIRRTGLTLVSQLLTGLNAYAAQLAQFEWRALPEGRFSFVDFMDDDGQGNQEIRIELQLRIGDGSIVADFTGTDPQVTGNINCPLSVTAAAVYYCFTCLLPEYTPSCAGTYRDISIIAPEGSLVNATYPAAVAAGNVETSSRIVDVVLGALSQALPNKMPAASQGSMNNISMGYSGPTGASWDYYETLAGGSGAHPEGDGLSARHSHMTNTLNTPVESIESHYPIRIQRYQVRWQSGGRGRYSGGHGVVRAYEFLKPATVTLLTERRMLPPWGLCGGGEGQTGCNRLNERILPAKIALELNANDVVTIETPGGGAWGIETK